jgi:hypothetical protein
MQTITPAVAASAKANSLLKLDRAVLLRDLNARACFVHHHLTDHPLLQVPRLVDLAKWLPEKYVRINSGAVPVDATPDQIPGTGQSVEESFRTLDTSTTRIMLKGIEHHPEYRALLHACLAEIEALGHPSMKGIYSRVGYVFLSAPNMTTPYHMDPEINFLLQTRGRKTFWVLPGDDRALLAETDIEEFYTGKHYTLPFPPAARERAVPFAMDPGDGVHIPVNNPHWVTTENEVTISLALTVETQATKKRGTVYAVNGHLRRLGLKPKPFGQSPVRDFLKDRSFRMLSGMKALIPGKKKAAPEH